MLRGSKRNTGETGAQGDSQDSQREVENEVRRETKKVSLESKYWMATKPSVKGRVRLSVYRDQEGRQGEHYERRELTSAERKLMPGSKCLIMDSWKRT